METPHIFASRGSLLGAAGGGGTTYGAFGGGFNDDGSIAAAAAAATAAAAAAAATAAAAHVPAPWFPPLVQQMESRKNETAQNIIKTQRKVSQVATLGEPAMIADKTGTTRGFMQRITSGPSLSLSTQPWCCGG